MNRLKKDFILAIVNLKIDIIKNSDGAKEVEIPLKLRNKKNYKIIVKEAAE